MLISFEPFHHSKYTSKKRPPSNILIKNYFITNRPSLGKYVKGSQVLAIDLKFGRSLESILHSGFRSRGALSYGSDFLGPKGYQSALWGADQNLIQFHRHRIRNQTCSTWSVTEYGFEFHTKSGACQPQILSKKFIHY